MTSESIFSNREIAAGIWLVAVVSFCIFLPSIRPLFLNVVAACFRRPIVKYAGTFFAYLLAILLFLSEIGIWDISYLKITLMWAIFSGLVAAFDAAKAKDTDRNHFRAWIADNIKALIFIEFLANAHSFPMWAELILLPVTTLLYLMMLVSADDQKSERVNKLFARILSCIVISYVGYSIFRIVSEWNSFVSGNPVAEIALPPTLSLLLIPFLYVTHLYVWYQLTGIRINSKFPTPWKRRLVKVYIALAFRGDTEALRRWSRNVILTSPKSFPEIMESVNEVKQIRIREKDPTSSVQKGWNPFAAGAFLESVDLKSGDYHRYVENDWGSATTPYTIPDQTYINTLSYYVYGFEDYADRLKIELFVGEPENTKLADELFEDAVASLIVNAVPDAEDRFHAKLALEEDVEVKSGGYKLFYFVDRFPVKNRYRRVFTLTYVDNEYSAA